ncbi:hypothetical protein [Enterobacter asburiae]|uniref:hypothetical protein n=1 Tax=Enterobacter asburiae TaxID=61645 RepID=UPI001F24BAB9|nr:hypothetical protein [Enterobacter asburiae]
MKTPINMLEDISAEVIENTSLLEFIYRNSNEDVEIDCAISCLIRSLHKTKDRINEYVDQLSNVNKISPKASEQDNISDDECSRRSH